jgi:tripartite-type tricarboxylate transporter receptor subunit TctC
MNKLTIPAVIVAIGAASGVAWSQAPAPILLKVYYITPLENDASRALADPAVRSRLAAAGVELFPRERQTPEALAAMVKADAEKWWPLIKELGIRAE